MSMISPVRGSVRPCGQEEAEWHGDLDLLKNSAEMGCSEVSVPEEMWEMVTKSAGTNVGQTTYHGNMHEMKMTF